MAGDTNSNIFINIDTSQAMAQLRLLEKELTALNRSLIVGTKAAAAAQAKYAQSLLHNVNATGQWTASMTRMSTASEQFSERLDRQRLSLKEYFRYGMASTKTFGKMFGSEFETVGKLVDKRVKTLQQQYVQLGRDAQGAMNAMKFNPKALNYKDVTTQLMMATQRQQLFNKLIDDGSTKLLNFGKNTQWAGRQLMVGFTIPLMLFGAQAIKVFKEIEEQTIRFKKVYGDIFTDQGATDAALKNIRALGDEYTKYGLKVSDTIKMAADAAAAGFSGKGLEQLVEQTNKLAVLGGVTQEKALETTIALKNAFQIDTSAMAGTIDFLNAVENQTVVALEDLTEAIPKVAPVIQQLGGDVKDLAYFMAAMQEGGISAAQGANALKSGLASLINPSNAASKAAAAVGVNIKGIVEANQGNLRNTVTGFAQALQPLTDLERSRVIEKVFGKYQFARISALLNNLGREGTQAARVLQLTNASVEELAILSQRELKTQADSPMNKLAASIEKLKVSIAPVGELFARVFTPVIEFIARMAEKFNNLPEGIKKAIGIITVLVGGLGPIFLMTFGLLANAVANSVKGLQVLRKGYQQLSAGSSDAALKTQYLTQQELENISVSNALYSKHQQLSAAYQLEATALSSLMSVYKQANIAMGGFASSNPGMFMPGRGGVPKKFASGTMSVPGPKGAGDVVPAMLSPGESVIPVKQTQKYSGFINQIIQDKVPGFITGTTGVAVTRAAATRAASTRGAVSSSLAPVISIGSRRGLSGIKFDEGADGLVTVTAGSESFKVKKENVNELKILLKDNQDWLESKGRLPGGSVSATKGYADTTEGKLEHAIRTRLQDKIAEKGGVLTPKLVFSKLQKYDASKPSPVPYAIKSLRAKYKDSPIYKELVATHKQEIDDLKALSNIKDNPYGITPEDILAVQKRQAPRGKDKELGYVPAFSHRFTNKNVDELSGLTQYKRNAPSNVFEEQSFFNNFFDDLSGTSLGGMHISRKAQAESARQFILDKVKAKIPLTPTEKLVHATLDRRLAGGYYEKFGSKTNQLSLLQDAGLSNETIRSFKRFRPKDEELPGFAGGVVSLGMPIPFKVMAKNRAMAQQIDARVRSSRFRETPPTNFGVKLQEFSGHSFPIPGIGGVYRKPNGQVVVVKPVLDEKAALAEQRATVIARQAHGLEAPEQSIKTMIDPTDLTGKRKIIVLESPYNPAFASGGTKFSKEDYFKQLVASTLRGDKDLSPSNVFGGTVTDVGAAGVFAKASGPREFNFKMPSMQDQAMINLLGVKGGARKAFAENTSDIARSMTPAQYQDEVIKEINRVLPKLEKTVASFNLTGVERVVYQRMIDRLKDGRDNVNWGKFQEVHSNVKAPLKLAKGIVSVPGPKGAGDIQPAMLSPGEAVIPAKQSEKYMPLIRSMIADNVPGYEQSNIPFGTPASLRPGGQYAGPIGSTSVATSSNTVAQTAAATKSTNRLFKAIDKVAAKLVIATPKIADLGTTADKTTESFGKDKTRGFRGFLGGYGNVQQTVANDDGTTRVASAAERTNMRQMNRMNFTQKMMPMQMAGMMIPMAAGMVAQKNPEGAIAKNMDAIMMLSMLTMLLPMLNSPLKLLAATAVGLIAVFKMQASTIKKNIIEGQKQAESMTMTTKQLEELGKITGRVSITQVAAAKRAGRNTDLSPVSMDFGSNIISSSEFGKNLKKTFNSAIVDLGEGAAVNSLVNQLGTAVSQGVLNSEQAQSIAIALTRDLKDARLEVNVRGQLIQLLGPNGKNVLDNPLQVQLELVTTGEKVAQAAIENLNKVARQQKGINTIGEGLQLAGGTVGGALIGARAGSQAASMVAGRGLIAQEMAMTSAKGAGVLGRVASGVRVARTAGLVASGAATATGVGAPFGAVGAAITAVITGGIDLAIRNWQKGKEKAVIAKAAGVVQGLVSQNITASQGSIDALTSIFDTSIANLELKKKTLKTDKERAAVDLEIAGLESKKQSGLQTLRQKQAKMLEDVSSNYDQVSGEDFLEKISPFGSGRGQVRDKYMEAFAVGMQDKFKDNAPLKAQAAALQSQLDQIGDDKVTLEISTLVTSDVLTPGEASVLVSTLTKAGGDIKKNLNALVSVQGTEGVQRLSTILTMLPDEDNQKNLVLAVRNLNKADADATFSSIEELGKIPDYIGIKLEIETEKSDLPRIKARGKEIEALKKQFPNGQVTLKTLVKMQEEAGGVGKNLTLDSAIKQWAEISKLDKNVQLQAILTIGSIEYSDSFDKILDRELEADFLEKNPKFRATAGRSRTGERLSTTKIDPKEKAKALAEFKKNATNIEKAKTEALNKIREELFPTAPVSGAVVPGATTPKGDGPTRDDSFLNDLAQRLKLVKEGGFDALKPLESLRKFLKDGGKDSINPGLDAQVGAIKQIEAAAKTAGISIDKDFMEIIRGLDAEQFKLWSATLFNVAKNGRITGLKEDFVTINEGFRKATIGGYIQDVKDASKEIENQVTAHQLLTKEGYNSLEIQKILQDATLTAKIVAQGGLKATKEEQAELNKEIEKTINLNYQLSTIKLNDNIAETKMQVEAFNRLTAAGVKHEVILEILKDKNNAFAIASADATINTKDKFGDLINKTKEYSDLLELIANQTKTFEQKTQDAIDANIAALDLQAKTLQNQFDLANFELKAKIVVAEDAVQKVNDDIQKEQDKIDNINFELKYDSKIGQNLLDDIQENINDAQRKMEIDFDRPLQALSDRSAVLSNDLTLIDKAAEAINEKYDKQEEALKTISELNQDIAAQERSRISLADALSQGDISAAAQIASDMRSTAADAANRRSGDFISAARKAETEGLRSSSGMTRVQIEAEQFKIGQDSYALEQLRKKAQEAILKLEDQVYNITELREAKLLQIRDIETVIDRLKNNQLRSAQGILDGLQKELDANQKILDAKLLAIDKEKLGWESVQIKLDAYKAKLTEINNGPLKTMKDIVDSILSALANISSAKYSPTSPFVPAGPTEEITPAQEALDAANAAADAADAAAAAIDAATAAAEAAADAVTALTAEADALAAKIQADLAKTNASLSPKGKKILADAAKAEEERLAAIAKQNAQWAAKAEALAAAAAKGSTGSGATVGSGGGPGGRFAVQFEANGGLINPMKFAMGGFAKGTDTVPAMLTPGEFVMSKYAVDSYGVDKMKAINSGSYEGEKVYNYNLNVNVKSDANPEDIARVVMTQIRQIDSQRIRTQRG
jgi:TP901 family phage tail tape measure protein